MYSIEFTSAALDDLKSLKKTEQKEVVGRIEQQLKNEPTKRSRNRKRLRPNDVAEWELRIRRFRVFYNVDENLKTVSIEAVGFKIGNLLFIRGTKADL